MDKTDRLSMLCGALAMVAVGGVAMATGHGGMSFSGRWLGVVALGVLVEVVLMRWVGPVVPMLLCMPLVALARGRPRVEAALAVLFPVLLGATAVGLAWALLRYLPGLGVPA